MSHMTEYLETWRRALEDRGMRISRPKTQFIEFKFGQDNGQGREPVKILGEELQRVHHLKYIGSSVEETGAMTTYISQRVSAAWGNWKKEGRKEIFILAKYTQIGGIYKYNNFKPGIPH